jgi:membrane fusion protein (multidrug efflux system)
MVDVVPDIHAPSLRASAGPSPNAMENIAPHAQSIPAVTAGIAPPRKRSPFRIIIPIVGVLGLLAALGAVKAAQIGQLIGFGKAMQAAGPPAENVGSAVAKAETWEATIAAVGGVEAGKGVTLSNDSPGLVTKLHFESGKRVKQGDVLVEIDTSVERAQLASAIARRDLALTNAKRSKTLVTGGVASVSQLETDEATYRTAIADAAALAAQIERKTVRAPFSGILGIRLVNVGQYLTPGTALAVLQSEDATFVDFTVPQQRLSEIAIGAPVRLTINGESGQALEGSVAAIDPTVDATTRSAKMRATSADPEKKLRPGMFVRVAVVLEAKHQVVVVPATALVHASYGDSVFIIENRPAGDAKPGKIVRQQFVRSGELRGDFVAIEDGLKGGEEIVSAGAFKLRNGAGININNDVGAKPERDPKPQNR